MRHVIVIFTIIWIISGNCLGADADTPVMRHDFETPIDTTANSTSKPYYQNVKIEEGALYLNGIYQFVWTFPDRYLPKPIDERQRMGYLVFWPAPEIDYNRFSISWEFKPEEFHRERWWNLMTGGPSCRWFGISVNKKSQNLMITFNNGDEKLEIKDVKLTPLVWHVITCTVDVKARAVNLYFDGEHKAPIVLRPELALTVENSEWAKRDKIFSPINGGYGELFKGWIDNLNVWNRILTAEEAMTLHKTSTRFKPGATDAIKPPHPPNDF
jgi:hypothetical protein